MAKVPVLDPELLPESLRARALDLSERFQAPPDYAAAALIVMLAGALGRRALIRPKRYDDWLVYGNLWGSIVGRSGTGKSPIIHAVFSPLHRRQALANAVYESESDEYLRHVGGRKGWKPTLAGSLVDPETPQPPVHTRYITNETSIEALHLILKANAHGVLLFRDELSGWIAELGKPGRERERSFYLETWAGNGSFTFDRVGRGTVYADNLCLSVFGGVQPGPLQAHVAEVTAGTVSDDGFLQRFQIMVWPDISSDWEDVDRPADLRAERRVDDIVDRLLKLSPEDPIRVQFSPAAQELFKAWRKELELKIRRADLAPALESHLAKYRSLLPKLALIFHLADVDDMPPEIPLVQAERAAGLCGYLEEHARRVYGCAVSHQQRVAATLAEKLRVGALGERFTLRDIYLRGWAGMDTAERARSVLAVLVEAGWVRKASVPVERGLGRPREEYIVNPAIRPD